jgi:hypothetical protein
METHGVLKAKIELPECPVVHNFQLVNKQVDIPCDAILGRDLLQKAKARICYESRTVILNGQKCRMSHKTEEFRTKGPNELKVGKIRLPPQTESVVRVPVAPGSPLVGLIDRCEVQEGVIMAASLTKVTNGYAMTSILNTNDVEVSIQEPLEDLEEIEPTWGKSRGAEFKSQDRERKIFIKAEVGAPECGRKQVIS